MTLLQQAGAQQHDRHAGAWKWGRAVLSCRVSRHFRGIRGQPESLSMFSAEPVPFSEHPAHLGYLRRGSYRSIGPLASTMMTAESEWTTRRNGTMPQPHCVYRTVKNNPPTRDDFLSSERLGKPMPMNEVQLRRWRGVSTFATLDQARRIAIANPGQGNFIAEVAIPADGRITYERTGKNAGHYTLWGDADEIVRLVISVVPAHEEETEHRGNDISTLG